MFEEVEPTTLKLIKINFVIIFVEIILDSIK